MSKVSMEALEPFVVGEDDGEAPLVEVLVEASHRCSQKMLVKNLLPMCWRRHVVVVHRTYL